MKGIIKKILLVVILGATSVTFAQKSENLPKNQLREIIELALDLPELQMYFHVDSNPERLPIKLKEFGELNATNLGGIKKFDHEILVLTNEDIKKKRIHDYINIIDWSYAHNTLKLTLEYVIEGITVNYMFTRKDLAWKITRSQMWE